MSPETGFVELPRLWWGASVIVVELLDKALGGEVVEVVAPLVIVVPVLRNPLWSGRLRVVHRGNAP